MYSEDDDDSPLLERTPSVEEVTAIVIRELPKMAQQACTTNWNTKVLYMAALLLDNRDQDS